MIGIAIPRFCDHPLLDPIGACRQCLVDIEGQRKPLASCTTVCTEGMVVKTQLTSAVAEKAQRGVMELLLDQPPARLPDVRQGRRVPAAEPGDRQRPGRVPLPRGQARVRQAGADLGRGAARPRAVHLLHPLRADLGGDRGRRLHRVPRARPGPVHRHRDRQAVQLLLLRQHGAGLPGRRAHRRGLPVQVPPVRPGVHAERVRALRGRLPPAHRPPAGPGAAPPGGRRAAGQRGVELRQGPLGVRLRQPVRPAHHPAGPRRRRRAPPGILGGRLRGGRARPRGRAGRGRGTVRRGRADRRAADARGRLRVRQVHSGRAEHQRHRHAGQAALGRGGAVPRRPGGRPRHRGQLRRPRGRARGAAGRVRAGGRVPDRVPAAAQGGPQDRARGCSPSARSPRRA